MKDYLKLALAAATMASLAAPSFAQDAQQARRTGNAPSASASSSAPAASTDRPAPGHGKDSFLEVNDANKDGKVTREEFNAARGETFKGLDLNKDGTVNELEYVAEYTVRLDQELAEQRARQIRQAHVRFGVLDIDKSGILAAAEFNESGDRMFSRLDNNGDGIVDAKDTAKGY